MNQDVEKILLYEKEIKERVTELGRQITKDYEGKEVVAIAVLKGSIIFFADLVREIDLPVLFDFIAVSSYGGSTSSGVVRFLKDTDMNIEDRHVLIIEDIIDTGLTLKYLCDNFKTRKPASMKICCLLDKPSRRKSQIAADYVGFEVPDEFVVGYGLDYRSNYRNLKDIGVLKPEIYQK